jgi:hypothetical protein
MELGEQSTGKENASANWLQEIQRLSKRSGIGVEFEI